MSHTRLIDTTIHDLSGPQVLEQVMRLFRQNRNEPVVIITRRGKSVDLTKNMRTVLSRQRKMADKTGVNTTQFGFELVSGPQEYKLHGKNLEAVAVQFRMTQRQHMLNLISNLDDNLGKLSI